jgi:hypothetical protein
VKTRSLRFLGNAMPQSKHRNSDMSSYLENKDLVGKVMVLFGQASCNSL